MFKIFTIYGTAKSCFAVPPSKVRIYFRLWVRQYYCRACRTGMRRPCLDARALWLWTDRSGGCWTRINITGNFHWNFE